MYTHARAVFHSVFVYSRQKSTIYQLQPLQPLRYRTATARVSHHRQWPCCRMTWSSNVADTPRIKSFLMSKSREKILINVHQMISDTEACRRLRSGSMLTLFMPATRRFSHGDQTFPVAAVQLWNRTLPVSLRTVSSYLTFRRELKTFLLNISFPDNWTFMWLCKVALQLLIVTL